MQLNDEGKILHGCVKPDSHVLDPRDAERFLKWYCSRNSLWECTGLDTKHACTLQELRDALDSLPAPDMDNLRKQWGRVNKWT